MNLVKFLFGLLIAVGGCAFCYWIVMLNLLVSLTSDQLAKAGFPYFAQEVTAWQLGEPMDTYGVGDAGLIGHPTVNYTAKGFPWAQMKPAGYIGPKSFICGAPIKTEAIVALTAGFDWQKIDLQGNPYLHSAFDYAIAGQTYPPPTEVMTVMGGQVVYANYYSDSAYGNLVVVENDGIFLYLAHLESISVSVGDVIAAGDVVGIMGSTGPSSAPHVHMEYRFTDNLTMDPRFSFMPGQSEACIAPYANPAR